jgi:Temperature dependent protein affecting M2 dsRNA replication
MFVLYRGCDYGLSLFRLPFIDENDCGLGIAVRTYLDDLLHQSNPTSPETRTEVKAKGKEWFQHSESFAGSLEVAFKLWDAVSGFCRASYCVSLVSVLHFKDNYLLHGQVYKATQNAGKEFKDAKLWDDANQWLAERR